MKKIKTQMECERDICNVSISNLNEPQYISIDNKTHKDNNLHQIVEWSDNSTIDYVVHSVNNGIYTNNLFESYCKGNSYNNIHIPTSISLKMSNCVNFSFKKQNESFSYSEENNNDYLVTIENVNFDDEEEKDTNCYNQIAKEFINQIFENAKKEMINNEYTGGVISEDIISKCNERILLFKNKLLQSEIEKRDQQIAELNNKLRKVQGQNKILIEENQKLLEIINIFKIMCEIDRKKKDECNINSNNINMREVDRIISNNKNNDTDTNNNYNNIDKINEELKEKKRKKKNNNNLINMNNNNNNCYINQVLSTKTSKKTYHILSSQNSSKKNLNQPQNTHNKQIEQDKQSLNTDYSNSYLFKEKKSYITVAIPTSKQPKCTKTSKSNNSYTSFISNNPQNKPLSDYHNIYYNKTPETHFNY